jgi:hypothetical protein
MQLVWADGESFELREREEINESTMADEIFAAARELPGGSWSKIRSRVRGNETEKAAVRDRLIRDGVLINEPPRAGPERRRRWLWRFLERSPRPGPWRRLGAVKECQLD